MHDTENEKSTTDVMTDNEIIAAFNKALTARKIVVRPKFYLKKESIQVIVSLLLLLPYLFVIFILRDSISTWFMTIILFLGILLFLFCQLKNLLLIAIFLYQRFAPQLIRSSCLFKPSCSEYMRLSIMKYGVCKGVIKGLNRLRRCRPPNGGIDEP